MAHLDERLEAKMLGVGWLDSQRQQQRNQQQALSVRAAVLGATLEQRRHSGPQPIWTRSPSRQATMGTIGGAPYRDDLN